MKVKKIKPIAFRSNEVNDTKLVQDSEYMGQNTGGGLNIKEGAVK